MFKKRRKGKDECIGPEGREGKLRDRQCEKKRQRIYKEDEKEKKEVEGKNTGRGWEREKKVDN